jgi:hypothetical protein
MLAHDERSPREQPAVDTALEQPIEDLGALLTLARTFCEREQQVIAREVEVRRLIDKRNGIPRMLSSPLRRAAAERDVEAPELPLERPVDEFEAVHQSATVHPNSCSREVPRRGETAHDTG